jgi:radical SAM superfamily enzyme YgiQ (UPF0313 family)
MSASRRDRKLALLVGSFRSVVPEGLDSPLGSQGGFVDTLAPAPYSLANGYLKTFALAHAEVQRRWQIELLDLAEPLYLEDERDEVALGPEDLERVLAHEPDLVAFSTYCWNLEAVISLARELRRRAPELVILLGGRATEGDAAELLREAPWLDAAVLGEGELPFIDVLMSDGRALENIAGLVARGPRGITMGGPTRCVEQLDRIPSPYLTGILEPPLHGVMLELSRGCLHRCGYCTWNADKRWRAFGPSRIEAEVRWAAERGHRSITLNDSAINYDTETLRTHLEAIERGDPEGLIRLTYNLRHERLDAEQLELLARLPTHMVLLGVETLNPSAMAEVDRDPVERAALHERLTALSRAVMPPVVSIVLGLPGDSEAGFLDTLETLLEWTVSDRVDQLPVVGTVLVSLLQVYRGSTLWRRRRELGLVLHSPGIPYLIEGPGWPREALARVKRRLIELMDQHPDQLKAAEAIVLMEALRQGDPWLTRRRLAALLPSWPLGDSRGGWTLLRTGLLRDRGRGFSLRFAWRDGGEARLVLRRRTSDLRRPDETRLFTLSTESLPGCAAPPSALADLRQQVRALLLEGEERLAQRRAFRSRLKAEG